MFTIVIPLYNKASYIEKAIESVLNQTFGNFELIIVNDGSTDDGVEKVALFNDDRLTVINQINAGVSTARNNGVKLAQYNYIVFLDADDWWELTFLNEMFRLISNYPDAVLYGSNYYIHKNGKSSPAKIGLDEDFVAGYINYFQVYSNTFWVPINCSFVVVKKSAFNAVEGFKPSLKFGEDLDLWIRIALRNKVAYLNKCLAYSNQDVVVADRALGTGKIWQKQEHVLFNIDYLVAEEIQHPYLKFLLDRLRLSSLVDYRLNNRYTDEVNAVIRLVDFSKHPSFYRFVYYWPRPLVNLYFLFKKYGSVIKQMFLKRYYQIS